MIWFNLLFFSKAQFAKKNSELNSKISALPLNEKLLRSIERQQKIKESLYILLLQKREEAAINIAITEPSVKIIEYAIPYSSAIAPKRSYVYLFSAIVGFGFPLIALYIIFFLDTKLHLTQDVENILPQLPIVAEIPFIKGEDKKVIHDLKDNTMLTEVFRIMSSNINFVLPESTFQSAKVIYCTSTIKGEGKTLISLNLSLILSSLNNKVLLIGADLRNPQIHNYIKFKKNARGLSNYLYDGKKMSWQQDLIKGFDNFPNHDILLSGEIPPNAPNLLSNGKFGKLIEEAKGIYDYIIVDTAPVILVTDTFLISKHADATLYAIRANYTEKRVLQFLKKVNEKKKLPNIVLAVNGLKDNKKSNYNYGYNYGYN